MLCTIFDRGLQMFCQIYLLQDMDADTTSFNGIRFTEHRMQNMCLQQLLFDIVHKTFIYSTGTFILLLFECATV